MKRGAVLIGLVLALGLWYGCEKQSLQGQGKETDKQAVSSQRDDDAKLAGISAKIQVFAIREAHVGVVKIFTPDAWGGRSFKFLFDQDIQELSLYVNEVLVSRSEEKMGEITC